MTRRENFFRAIQFNKPEWVPLNTGYCPEPYKSMGDCMCVGYKAAAPGEWLYHFTKLEGDKTIGQVTEHPLSSVQAILDFKAPPLALDVRFQGVKERVDDLKKQDLFVFGSMANYLFERMHYLVGMEDLFDYLYNEREAIQSLGDKIVDFQCEMIKEYAKCGVDALWGGDDWGLQDRLMIAPDLWRELFKPWYTRMFQTAKSLGLITYMHSCGKNNDIINDLIECGLDVIELHQPTVYGVDWLSKNAGGRLCFSTTADLQRTLPTGDKETILKEVIALKEKLGSFNGGLLYEVYPDYQALDITPETVEYYVDCCVKNRAY
ncbi:MAG TPA: uroporphyrinogen decarboxylase family protein [Oscillospiraceae bacterium]|nr:uroporphyrinogen decarboxylase family protein [Oscillospiraceae bacterium]HPF55547.1 uroporphyrinogen decarboxylase family protein [Clostridiales bacterium]HPK35309.1 uroporphyrinogen decarboxylase family protein [Oscillospiraceae bacterium]HPR76245.1 uroporphyrinogen decarboxylase family protein [Oscillospiraceae bacterium]